MTTQADVDDFGLPIRRYPTPKNDEPADAPTDAATEEKPVSASVTGATSDEQPKAPEGNDDKTKDEPTPPTGEAVKADDQSDTFEDARSEQSSPRKETAREAPAVAQETPTPTETETQPVKNEPLETESALEDSKPKVPEEVQPEAHDLPEKPEQNSKALGTETPPSSGSKPKGPEEVQAGADDFLRSP
jgi:hypothetical protein